MPEGAAKLYPGFGGPLGKVLPEHMAGLIGLPYVGKVIYVDATDGSDTANDGSSQSNALATVSAGYTSATSLKHEVVLITPGGGSGRTTETTAITWNKRFTHLVGNSAPTAQDTRAGLSFGTGGSIDFQQNGCLVKNITFNGTTDINVPVTLSGDYNSFIGVDFKGSLNDTTGDNAAARSLYINGGEENYFGGCFFGADTFIRSTTNATIEFANAASRNVFEKPRFIMRADNTGPVHILFTGTSAIDRWIEFNDSSWYSFWANDADKITAVMDLSAQSATGHVRLTGSLQMEGADDWEASDSSRIFIQPHTATANAIGIAINPSVS